MTGKNRPPGSTTRGPGDTSPAGHESIAMLTHRTRISVESLPPDIASRIEVNPATGELVWTGPVDKDGYGKIRGRGAHRVVYEVTVGPVPPGLVLDHVKARGCTTNACVSWWHLQPVTNRINILRGRSFAAVNARKVRCDHGHPFDLFNTYYSPDGRRCCRRCNREAVARYKQRQRALPALARAA